MSSLRFGASLLSVLVLLGLCVLLAGPAFEMRAAGTGSGIGAGAFPQFVVVSVAALALAILVQDFRRWRRGGDATGPEGPEAEETAPVDRPARVVGLGIGVFALLALFIFAWQWIGFLAAAIGFMALLSLLLAPPAARSPRGLAITLATSVLFCIGLWALFVHVLAVPLR